MKKIPNIIALCGLVFTLGSCDLMGPIDDIHPYYRLDDDNVITDAAGAENMLRGVYAYWRASSITSMRVNMSLYGGALNSLSSQIYMVQGGQDFLRMDVPDNNMMLEPFYKDLYKVINMANLAIEKLEAGKAPDLSPARRTEMIAECRFHRGLAHFYLLRHFGQFYDQNSPYGVELRRAPFRGLEIAARENVGKVYRFILDDLEAATAKAPERVPAGQHYNITRMTAKAMQARVLLCARQYGEAATLAAEVIRDAGSYGYVLTPDYAEIFSRGHAADELLFGIYSYGMEEVCAGDFNYTVCSDYSEQLGVRDAVHDLTTGEGYDHRFAVTYAGEPMEVEDDSEIIPDIPGMDPTTPQKIRVNHKYPFRSYVSGEQGNPYYLMRLAEVYYIHAEAAARENDPDGARNSLAAVLERSGYTRAEIDEVADGELLEYIRRHKWIELFSENNEEWFDLVRYYKEGNLSRAQLKTIRNTFESEKQLILPLPRAALAGNHLLVQNP